MNHETLNRRKIELLQGCSPRARGKYKEQLALNWIYQWGWSAPSIVDTLGDNEGRGLSARLVKNQLLCATVTANGGVTQGVPRKILTLTRTGLSEVERHLDEADLLPYELNPHKINQDLLRHGYYTQCITDRVLRSGQIQAYYPEKTFQSQTVAKLHDVVWLFNGQRVGIEMELTAKWGRAFDQFVWGCVASIQSQAVQQVYLFSDSAAIVRRYQEGLRVGKRIGIWSKNSKGFWVQQGDKPIPDDIAGRIVCRHVDL